jgi:hypothetical protein
LKALLARLTPLVQGVNPVDPLAMRCCRFPAFAASTTSW